MAVQTAEASAATAAQNGHANDAGQQQNSDPVVEILDAFYSIPDEYHPDLFSSFRDAADSHDLRRLLEAISDWAATAQLYTNPDLAAGLTEAIGTRKGAADWLTG